MFYLYEVLEKCVAKEEIEEDDSCHLFTRGEQYLKCRYLQPLKQKKGMHYYKKHVVVVFVNPLHILCPCVNISEDLTLSADDFQFLTDAMLWISLTFSRAYKFCSILSNLFTLFVHIIMFTLSYDFLLPRVSWKHHAMYNCYTHILAKCPKQHW